MRYRFLVTNPHNDESIRLFTSVERATKYALAENRKSGWHPSLMLFTLYRGKATYVGRLWRAFGMDFRADDCWRTEDDMELLSQRTYEF